MEKFCNDDNIVVFDKNQVHVIPHCEKNLDEVKKKPILLKDSRTPEDGLWDTDLIVPGPDDIYKRQLDTTCDVFPSGHAGLYLGTNEKKIHCDLRKMQTQPGGATKKKFKGHTRYTRMYSRKLE